MKNYLQAKLQINPHNKSFSKKIYTMRVKQKSNKQKNIKPVFPEIEENLNIKK